MSGLTLFRVWPEWDETDITTRYAHGPVHAAELVAESLFWDEPFHGSALMFVSDGTTTKRVRVYIETEPVFDGRLEPEDA